MKLEIKHLLLKSIQLKNAHDTAALNNTLLTSIRTSRPASPFMRQYNQGNFPPVTKIIFSRQKKINGGTDR